MALINCRECEKKISSRAKTCPHCGCPNEHPIQSHADEIGVVVGILLSFAFFLYLFSLDSN